MTPTTHEPLPVTAVIFTFNEEKNLPKCLDSIAGQAAEIVIVDSFSTDATLQIAARYTDKVVQNKYEGHPQQWDWALTKAPITQEWIFAIDADFVVTDALWKDLRNQLQAVKDTVNGFYVRHREVFRGRAILFGGIYPNRWLRIFRRGEVTVDLNELVDVHFYVKGQIGTIEYDVIEQNYKDDNIFFWIQKQNNFARKQALEELGRRSNPQKPPMPPTLLGNRDQRKLAIKLIWYRLPLYFRPCIYFLYRYVFRLGFLDGRAGFVYHFTQGFLYRLLVDINIEELSREVHQTHGSSTPET